MSQNDPKTTSLMTSVTKIRNPQPKNFFECNLLDWPTRLSSSLAQSAEELGHC